MKRLPRVPLSTLRAFEAAARQGGFRAAAEELHVTPAAISHRIKTLEARIGIRLFERRARGVALTEAGQRYRDRLAEAFALIERATEELHQPRVAGALRVSAPHALLSQTLLPRLGELRRRHPGLVLTLEGEDRLASLHDGEVDAAIRFGPGRYPGLHAEPLLGDAITVVGPPGSAPGTDWRAACFIEDTGARAAEPWSHWAPWWREAGLHDPEALCRLRVSDSGLALAACREGLGLCLARFSVVHDLLRAGRVVPLHEWRPTEFGHYLVSRPATAETPRLAAFRDWLDEALAPVAEARRQALSGHGVAQSPSAS
ncbi:LysR family transcriptional regulator [Halomonas organivorans]